MPRERRPYGLNTPAESLRAMSRGTQADLDALVETMNREYVENGVLSAPTTRKVMMLATQAQISHLKEVGVIALLDSASVEDAQREAEMYVLPRAQGGR